jgi:hypothetical protein
LFLPKEKRKFESVREQEAEKNIWSLPHKLLDTWNTCQIIDSVIGLHPFLNIGIVHDMANITDLEMMNLIS